MSDNKLIGVDVSHWNRYKEKKSTGSMMAEPYKSLSSIDFMIAKATQGIGYKDSEFDNFMNIACGKGLLRGAYHFVSMTEPYEQALNFVSTVRPYGDCLLALDFEDSDGAMKVSQDTINNYLYPLAKYVKLMTDTPPLIYASKYVFDSYDFSEIRKLDCGVWVAKWDRVTDKPTVKNWKSLIAIKQYTDKGRIDELVGNTDLNVAYMTKDVWKKYANPRL